MDLILLGFKVVACLCLVAAFKVAYDLYRDFKKAPKTTESHKSNDSFPRVKPQQIQQSKIQRYYSERKTEDSWFYWLARLGQSGSAGERKISNSIRCYLDKNSYILHDNITLPLSDGTTQIDHIVVSKFGVFVIESKEMSGWVFGTKSQRQWTQMFPNKKKIKFQNPIHQNFKHVKAVENFLGIKPQNLISVVVFSGTAELKTVMPEGVMKHREMIPFMRRFCREVYSQDDLVEFSKRLDAIRLPKTLNTDARHTAHIQEKLKAKKC